MTKFTLPVISQPGEGQMAMGFGPHLVRMCAAETGNTFGLVEVDVPAGEGPPLHLHEREDEFFRVLSGRFLFVCGDSRTELTEGGCVLVPRGVPHRFQNTGDTVGRLMAIFTPGGFEGFFAAVEQARPDSPAALDRISAQFGIRFLDEAAIEVAA